MRVLAAPIVVALLALLALPGTSQAIVAYDYTQCAPTADASIVEVIGADCSEAQTAATQVSAAATADEATALRALGWAPLRASAVDSDDTQHDLIATRGTAALRIRRSGPAPDLDGWDAGRELILARKPIVGGGRVPSGSVLCTTSWLVRLSNDHLGGLTAAHCGGLSKSGKVQRKYIALRRPPQPGIVLGRVQRILKRTQPLDALVAPVPSGDNRSRIPLVDRGVTRPPWRVTGIANPTPSRKICFTGRTSGADQCGRIASRSALGAERLLSAFSGVVLICTTIRAREGDSGGPVYTAPRTDGSVHAVGLTTVIVGASARMCFTPLAPVLRGLKATLVVSAT
ncbi:MAG TPA: hypothetical protein VGF63_00925 [Solirubrobacteraceae bacterium]|jgi:hypothetical protein